MGRHVGLQETDSAESAAADNSALVTRQRSTLPGAVAVGLAEGGRSNAGDFVGTDANDGTIPIVKLRERIGRSPGCPEPTHR